MTASILHQHAWFGQHHVREDTACNSPHPSPMLGGQHVSRQSIPNKRKRTDSFELPAISCNRESFLASPFAPGAWRIAPPSSSLHELSEHSECDVAAAAATVQPDVSMEAPALHTPDYGTQSRASKHTPSVDCQVSVNGSSINDVPLASENAASARHTVVECLEAPVASRQDLDAVGTSNSDVAAPSGCCTESQSVAASKSTVHDQIELYLNTKILFKHKELGTIEAEIAKCQVSLEQLRRCFAVPYPGQQGSHFLIDKVITGIGPSLEPHHGCSRPAQPAPYGVIDGPYTRHYARWLIPDGSFDATPTTRPPRAPTTIHAPQVPAGRKARVLDDSAFSKPKRASTSMFTQFSSQASLFTNGHNRLIVKTNDGVWVKIVCKKCGKADSSNIQGFMNHTRIAHSLSYDNHVAVVKDCSQELDTEEAEVVQKQVSLHSEDDQAQQLQQPQPQSRRKHSAPVNIAVVATGRPRLAALLDGPSRKSTSSNVLHSMASAQSRISPLAKSQREPPTHPSHCDFEYTNSSTSGVPSLSRLMIKRGSPVDLESLVTGARKRIDLDSVDVLVSDSESGAHAQANEPSPQLVTAATGGSLGSSSRMPARMNTIITGPSSSTSPCTLASSSDALDSNLTSSVRHSLYSDPAINPSPTNYYTSAHVSPRGLDNPGMTDDDDEDDLNRISEHGDDVLELSNDPSHTDFEVCFNDSENVRDRIRQEEEAYSQTLRGDDQFTAVAANSCTSSPLGMKKRGRPKKNMLGTA